MYKLRHVQLKEGDNSYYFVVDNEPHFFGFVGYTDAPLGIHNHEDLDSFKKEFLVVD